MELKPGKEISATETRDLDKLQELSSAPVKSRIADYKKDSHDELLSDRLSRRKEAKSAMVEEVSPSRKEQPECDFAEIEDSLNRDSSSPSFGASQGTCRKMRINQHYCGYSGF